MTASIPPALRVLRADYANPTHARDLLALLRPETFKRTCVTK